MEIVFWIISVILYISLGYALVFVVANWPWAILAFVLAGYAAPRYSTYIDDKLRWVVGSEHRSLYLHALYDTNEVPRGSRNLLLVLGVFGILADMAIFGSMGFGVFSLFLFCIMMCLLKVYIKHILTWLLAFYILHLRRSDRRKINKMYNDGAIKKFMCDKGVFTLSALLESLYKENTLSIKDRSEALGTASYVMENRFNEHFVTVKGDLPTLSYDTYCMPLADYSQLKEEILVFLHGAGVLDIVDITKRTTGFVAKAYFTQKALNDLVADGSVTKMEIGNTPEKGKNAGGTKHVYQHKDSQRPMKSTEIGVD